jgi:hypothetical protein
LSSKFDVDVNAGERKRKQKKEKPSALIVPARLTFLAMRYETEHNGTGPRTHGAITHIINQTNAVHVKIHPISPASNGAKVESSSWRTIISVPYGLIVASEAVFEEEEIRP